VVAVATTPLAVEERTRKQVLRGAADCMVTNVDRLR